MYNALLSVFFLGIGMQPAATVDSDLIVRQTIAPPTEKIIISEPLSASGVLIMNMETGQTLFRKAEKTTFHMASLTKLMTALIIAETEDLDATVRIRGVAEHVEGSRAYLQPGETFTVGQMLSALLIVSANDAADELAYFHSGSREKFVEVMNTRAASLGLRGTSFVYPSGFDHTYHFSTLEDIAALMRYVISVPALRERLGTRHASITGTEQTIPLDNTHQLLLQGIVELGKTGTTDDAGQCLVSVVRSPEGSQYIIVILGSADRYADMGIILRHL